MMAAAYENAKAFGLDYLGKVQIDQRMDELATGFDPGLARQPHPVNIERLIIKQLGIKVVSETLSTDASVLGMYAAKAKDVNRFEQKDGADQKSKGEILIEKRLYLPGHANRRRLTLAHLAAHAILHRDYLLSRESGNEGGNAIVKCTRQALKRHAFSGASEEPEMDAVMEYQANSAADALLMPRSAVRALFKNIRSFSRRREAEDAIILTAATFRVTEKAARRRLKELGYIQKPKEYSIIVFGQKLASACMF